MVFDPPVSSDVNYGRERERDCFWMLPNIYSHQDISLQAFVKTEKKEDVPGWGINAMQDWNKLCVCLCVCRREKRREGSAWRAPFNGESEYRCRPFTALQNPCFSGDKNQEESAAQIFH